VEETAVRTYGLICFTALMVLVLTLVQRGRLDFPGLLPVLVGLIGLVGRWGSTPPLFLLTLSFVILDLHLTFVRQWEITASFRRFQVADLIMVAAALAFLGAFYRLLGLTRQIFPADPRPRKRPWPVPAAWLASRPAPGAGPWRRSTRLLMPEEVFFFVLTVLGWTLAARLGQLALARADNPLALSPTYWHAMLLLWFLGLCLLVARSLFGYAWLRRLTVAEACLLLEDELWHATRGEQRLVQRWLAWARLKGRRKEKS
jgi:hypothetical protein